MRKSPILATACRARARQRLGAAVLVLAAALATVSVMVARPGQAVASQRAAASPAVTIITTDTAGVGSLAYSPNGETLATGATISPQFPVNTGQVQLWDVATGQEVGQPLGPAGSGVLGFASGGSTLLTESGATVDVWDVATGQLTRTIALADPSTLDEVTMSPDGTLLATVNNDETVNSALQLWDVATGQPVGNPAFSDISFGNILRFSPDGKVVGTDNGSGVQLWKVTSGDQLRPGPTLTVNGNSSIVYSLAFTPDDTMAATGDEDNTVQLWDAATGKPVGKAFTAGRGGIGAVDFSPNGAILATGDGFIAAGSGLRLWEPATASKLIAGPYSGGGGILTIAFSPQGTTVVTGNNDGTARLFHRG